MDIRETLEDTGMLPSSTEQAEGYILDSYRDVGFLLYLHLVIIPK